ncbi:hypothetical protein HY837_04910 [archaeon]|nr:hypothetical protein [archaeon]
MSLINEIKSNYVLYILGSQENMENFEMSPFGLPVRYINPLLTSNKTFTDLLVQLDGLSYGDKNLGMEKWVALDCGMLPSAFIGLAKKADSLDSKIKEEFSIPKDYSGLVPITMYCAIPSTKKGLWISHSLAAIEQGKGLGLVTKILGLKIFQAKELIGIAQYNNKSVKIHTKISHLKILSAITSAHSIPEMTFVYQHKVDQDNLENALKGNPCFEQPSCLLNANDLETKQKMQEEIEQKTAEFYIIPPGQVIKDGEIYIPILKEEK